MIKNFSIENLEDVKLVEKEEVKKSLDYIVSKIDENIEIFKEKFPSACTTNGKYRIKDNDDWTNGFWTGMLWLAYEYTGNEKYRIVGREYTKDFKKRYEENFVLDHHDLGFLYSLSAVADYKVTGSKEGRVLGILAAEKLKNRYHDKGKFIQAWGQYGDEKEYRLIIDCLLNLPLLYWAYEETGDESFKNVANTHFNTTIKNIVREDYSTYHTYYFDKETGKGLKGITHQGFRDDSCWARGQAWAILGMPLNFKYNKNKEGKSLYEPILNYYLEKIPEDYVPYWDLIFKEEDNEPRDSSSAAITICGMFEMNKYLSNGYEKEAHTKIAHKMLRSLMEKYTSENKDAHGILLEGVYAYHHNKGINECNLWGDYFYMEGLMRLYKEDFKTYW